MVCMTLKWTVPQLIITGQTNSTLLGTKFFQETNISKMVDDVAVFHHQVQKGDDLFEITNEAIRTAYEKWCSRYYLSK